MATFRGLSLDALTHDLHVDASGNLVLAEDNAAIAQHVKQRLHFYEGEWFLDTLAGTPWFQDVFVRPHNQVVIEAVIKREILDTPGIAELTAFDLRIDERKRHIEVLEAAARSTLDADLNLQIPVSLVPQKPKKPVVVVPPAPPPIIPQPIAYGLTLPNWSLPQPVGAASQPAAGIPVPLVFTAPVLPTPAGGGSLPKERLFSDTKLPTESSTGLGAGLVIGVNLYFTEPGIVQAVHFWRDASSSSSIAIGIWDSAGTLIDSRTLTKVPPASDSWDAVSFTTPVPVEANTKYTVGWWQDDVSGTTYYARNEEEFVFQVESPNGIIIVPADGSMANGQSYVNGVTETSATLVLPTSPFNSRNYFVDVTFSGVQQERLFSDSMVPDLSAFGTALGLVIGVNLYFTVPGHVRTVHFWRSASSSSSIAIGIWDSTGALIDSRTLTKAPPASDGWDSVDFTAPVEVDSGTKYTVGWWQDDVAGRAYYARNEEAFVFQTESPNGVIVVPAHNSTVGGQDYVNGVTADSDTLVLPDTPFNSRNYFVDVTFTYGASGSLVLLKPLFFSSGGIIPEGRPAGTWVGDLQDETDGGTLTLIDDGGGRFVLDQLQIYTTSTPIDYETLPVDKKIAITVRETHPQAVAPRDTVLNITITDVDEPDADATAFLNRIAAAGVTTTPEYPGFVDLFFKRIKRVPGLYAKIHRLGNSMLAPSDAVALWDWKNAANNASVSGAYTRSNRGITWTGAATQLIVPAMPNAPAGQNSQFVGFFVHQYTWASARNIIGSSNGQIQVIAPPTSNTGNLSARLNGNSSLAGTGAKHASLWGLVFLDRSAAVNFTLGINAGEQNEFIETLAQPSVAPTWTSITFDAEDAVVGGWVIGEHLTEAERAHLRYCLEAFKYEFFDSPEPVVEEGNFVADANPNSRIGSPGILRPTLIGYKPSADMTPTGPAGYIANTNNMRFSGFSSRNMGNGSVVVVGTIDGLVVEDIDFINGYRGVEVKNANCTNFRFRRLNMYGAEKSLIRIADTSGTFNSIGGSAGNPALIEDCYIDTGGAYFVGDPFQVGIDISNGDYITLRRCTAKNAMMLRPGFKNGDGFLAERVVTNLRYEQCVAEGNVDGGFDTKPPNTVFVDCESRFNSRNFKFWGTDVQYTGTTISRSPASVHFQGASSGTDATCTIENLVIESTNIDVPIFEFDADLGNGICVINILNYTFVGGMMADQALLNYRNINSFTVNWGPQGRPPGGRDVGG